MNWLLKLFPAYRRLSAMAQESAVARVNAESEVRDLRMKVTNLQEEVIAARTETLAVQKQLIEDTRKVLDSMRLDMRLAPIFHQVSELPAPAPLPEAEAHSMTRPRAEQVVAQFEDEFNKKMAELYR